MATSDSPLNVSASRGLSVALGQAPQSQGVIFQDNFDAQPDFTSTMHTTAQSQVVAEGNTLPVGWDAMYQGTKWSPETGYPTKHASLEILASNTDKTRNGVGKSAVHWRESYDAGWNNFNSDSQIQTLFDQDVTEVYMEFWLCFSPNWAGRNYPDAGQSKIVRIGHYKGTGDPFNGAPPSDPALGPVLFWDYLQHPTYGQQNNFALRGGPPGYNYQMDVNGLGIESQSNYGSATKGMAVGGGDPQLVDHVNGGILANIDRYDFIFHEQIWGLAGTWTKIGLYVKMNSAPGMADGVLMHFVNDERIKVESAIPWVGDNPEGLMVGWNYISIGGNDFFRAVPNDQLFEDWYAIDDLVVSDSLPAHLK